MEDKSALVGRLESELAKSGIEGHDQVANTRESICDGIGNCIGLIRCPQINNCNT